MNQLRLHSKLLMSSFVAIASAWVLVPLQGVCARPVNPEQKKNSHHYRIQTLTVESSNSTRVTHQHPTVFSDTTPEMHLAQTLEAEELDLDQNIIENSPVLQRWLEASPDILEDIQRDPAFRTRLRIAYAHVDNDGGILINVDDVFIGETGLTLNADYADTFNSDRQSWGVTVRYYVLPLGKTVNLAPVVGYRALDTSEEFINGAEVGLRLFFIPSRTGAADFSATQSWVNPGNNREEASLTTFTAGYALNQIIRLSSDIQIQVTPDEQDTRFSVGLELML